MHQNKRTCIDYPIPDELLQKHTNKVINSFKNSHQQFVFLKHCFCLGKLLLFLFLILNKDFFTGSLPVLDSIRTQKNAKPMHQVGCFGQFLEQGGNTGWKEHTDFFINLIHNLFLSYIRIYLINIFDNSSFVIHCNFQLYNILLNFSLLHKCKHVCVSICLFLPQYTRLWYKLVNYCICHRYDGWQF